MADHQLQSGRNKQRESRRPTVSPASTTSKLQDSWRSKLQDSWLIHVTKPLLAEDSEQPSIQLLRKLGFGLWPSSHFGPVLPDVLEQLKRAHQILTSHGFVFVNDPSNPLGDGKSWVLICEPPIQLPNGLDPARFAQLCLQKIGINPAVRPVLDGKNVLIPVGDSWKDAVVSSDDFEAVGEKQTAPSSLALAEMTPASLRGPQSSHPIPVGVARALLVEKIRREITVISQSLTLLEDYDAKIRCGQGNFSGFVTVTVCDQHSDLCDKLCAIKETRKPKIVYLACEIAARANRNGKPLRPKTYEDAYDRYGKAARELMDRSEASTVR